MARKRFIKPEFFRDVDMAELSIEARYLYAGMWPWMDRQGVIEADPRVHRANVFPHDEKITAQKVQGWLNELIQNSFVVKFSWQGKELLYCPTFILHQRLFPDEQAAFNVSDELLESFKSNAVLPAHSRHLNVTVPSQSMHSTVQEPVEEKEEVKVEEEEKKANFENFDFEPIYAGYPRKRGKDEGMQRLVKRITDRDAFDRFAKAVKQYARECRLERTEPSKMMYWSTFVGTERDGEPWKSFADSYQPPALVREPEPHPEPPQLTAEERAEKSAQISQLLQTALNYSPKKEGA